MLIRKAENSTGKENVVDATPIRHKTCAVVDCKGNAICHYPSGCQVQLAFEDATSPGDMFICKAHYNTCTTKKRHCGQCLTLLVPTEPSRKSPNITSVASKLRQDGIKVNESDVFCTACYKAQLEMIRVDGQASTDYKLKKTIEQHLGQSDSLAQVIVMTGNALLVSSAVLLVTVHNHYIQLTGDKKPAKWLLDKLVSALGEHFEVVQPKAKKRGILLLRKGCDTQQALHDALAVQRLAVTSAQVEDGLPEPAQQQAECQEDAVSAMCETIHGLIKKQATTFKSREYHNLAELSDLRVEEAIAETDPILWRTVWVMAYGSEPAEPTPLTAHGHTKRIRCLFILSALMHAAVPACTYPLHTALSDIVDAYSHSTELMKVLA